MAKSKLLVTTTSNIEGWEIEAYLGTISAHIVAGTGLFSDWAASFSDVFGGRSISYQKQLAAINNEVIEALKLKATLLGANCILGLKIDHDEISGKSKQMFMVSAHGTAVKAVQLKNHESSEKKKTILVTSEDLSIALKTQEIIKKTKNLQTNFNEEEQYFIIENHIYQIAPSLLEALQREYENLAATPDLGFIRRYFLALPGELVITYLYDALVKFNELNKFITDTIINGDLFDYTLIRNILSNPDFEKRKKALALCRANKPVYTLDDIQMLRNLIEAIKSTFVMRANYLEKTSMLSSKVKTKWQCECGAKNDDDVERCGNCTRDKFGFYSGESNPENTIELLERKINILENMFSDNNIIK